MLETKLVNQQELKAQIHLLTKENKALKLAKNMEQQSANDKVFIKWMNI